MKSLLEHFNELANWDYYKRKSVDTIKKVHNWNDNNEHKEFIEKFLEISGKNIVQDTFEKINDLKLEKFERLEHINSVFFLGCLLYENTIFSEKINFDRPNNYEKDEFYFIWFLTSLVHDFGYSIEKNVPDEVDNDIESFKTFIKSKSNESEFYNLLNEKFDISENLKILLDNVPKYYRARMDGQRGRENTPKIDHGISAGLILFNTLKYIRIAKQTELRSFGVNDDIDEENDLYWGDDLDRFYFVAASSIAVHNTRRVSRYDSDYEEQKKLYQHYRMDALVLDEDKIKKLSIEDEPFLFLFSIVDTIEPTKIFKCQSAEYVLENICIDFTNQNTIIIKKVTGADLSFQKLIDKVDGLDNWLNIEKPICTNDFITIIIKENEV